MSISFDMMAQNFAAANTDGDGVVVVVFDKAGGTFAVRQLSVLSATGNAMQRVTKATHAIVEALEKRGEKLIAGDMN